MTASAGASTPAGSQSSASGSTAPHTVGRSVPAGFAPVSVTFVSDQRGWVLGSAPCAGHVCATVLHTSDGGKSWRRVSAPKAPVQTASDQPTAVDQLRFANSRDGYADGVGLWQTHDGGARWARNSTVAGIAHAVVSDIVASGAYMYAVVSGTDSRYGGSDSHLRLARSDAATGAFHVIADLGSNEQADDLTASGGVVYFLANRIGNSRGSLIRVQGGALTRMPLPAEGCGHLAASTSKAVLLVCGGGVANGSMGRRVVYGSSNSGRSYHRLPGPGRGAGYDGSEVADAGNEHAVITTAGGGSAALRSTANGGQSWHTSLSVENAQFSELGFEDDTHGVVIATLNGAHQPEARLYRTTTAGASWNRIAFR